MVTRARRRGSGGGFLRWVEFDDFAARAQPPQGTQSLRGTQDPQGPADLSGYPFSLPVVAGLRAMDRLKLDAAVTFLVGDNGTGKSTLVEAIAVAAGFNAEGGSTHFRFSTRASESTLGAHLRLVRGPTKPRTGFFLRAESFYNVATEIDRLGELDPYGGRSLHERSHGESFLDLVTHRFGPQGLYLLDEPEAALSVHGCLALLARIRQLAQAGSQFIIATHSPVVLAVPDALILQIDPAGAITTVSYDEADTVVLTRSFLAAPDRYLHHLLADEP